MNELEKKIYEYLETERGIEFSVMNKTLFIKDLAEIAYSYFDVMTLEILELRGKIEKLKKEKEKNELENKRNKQKEIYNLTGREVDLEDL